MTTSKSKAQSAATASMRPQPLFYEDLWRTTLNFRCDHGVGACDRRPIIRAQWTHHISGPVGSKWSKYKEMDAAAV